MHKAGLHVRSKPSLSSMDHLFHLIELMANHAKSKQVCHRASGYGYPHRDVRMRYALSPMIMAAVMRARIFVMLWLTNSPITFLLLV